MSEDLGDLVRIELPVSVTAYCLMLRGLGKRYPHAVILTDGPHCRPGMCTIALREPVPDPDNLDDEDE